MSIHESQIDTFSKKEISKIRRINLKREKGTELTAKDLEFERWYELESQRQYERREYLKAEGWALINDQTLSLEDHLRGAEMICYAHWHRAFNAESFPIDVMEYVGCWVEATAPDLFDFHREDSLIKALREKYPLKSKRRLKRGYTYVWRIE